MGGKGQKGSGNGLPRNNKNRPAGSGTTSHARRERVRAAAQARDKAKEEEEKAKKEEQRVKDEEEKKMMDKKKEEENQNMKDQKKEEDKQVSLDKREIVEDKKAPLTRGKLQKTRRFPLTKGKVQRSWAQVTPKRKKTLGLICSKEKRSGSQNLLLLLQALPATFHPCQKGPLLPRLLAKRRNLLPVTRKRLLVKRNQHKKAAAAAAQNQSPVIGEAAAQTSHPQHPTQRKKTRWMTQALGRSQRRSQKSQQYWYQSCLNGWLWIGTRPLSQKMGTLTEGHWKSSERLAAKSGWCPGVAMKESSKCDKN
jgi:hypothetical protein